MPKNDSRTTESCVKNANERRAVMKKNVAIAMKIFSNSTIHR